MVELRAFHRLEKETQMQYFIVISVTGMPRAFHYCRYKTPHNKEQVEKKTDPGGEDRSCPLAVASGRAPLVIPQGP